MFIHTYTRLLPQLVILHDCHNSELYHLDPTPDYCKENKIYMLSYTSICAQLLFLLFIYNMSNAHHSLAY